MSPMPVTGRSTSTTTTTATTTTAGHKLRDSCHACAFSKVKCLKEKPACSRCVKRGLTCWYVASKRSSRKHESRPSASENGNRHGHNATTALAGGDKSNLSTTAAASPLESCFVGDLAEPGSNYLPPPEEVYPLLRTTSDWTSSLFSAIPSPAELSLSPDPTTLATDLNGFFASPVSFSVPSASDTDMSSHSDFFTTAMETESGNSSTTGTGSTLVEQFAAFEDAASKLLEPELSEYPPGALENTIMSAETHVERRRIQEACAATDATHSCLVQAWGLMKLLSPKPCTPCRSSPVPTSDGGAVSNGASSNTKNNSSGTHPPDFETIIANNEQTIETINSMLQCPCLDGDGYLLMTLFMLVFKVLDWYALAARNTSAATVYEAGLDPTPSVTSRMGSYCVDGEDAGRMVAQLVLSKLHHVQRLVNQLSASFKAQAAAAAGLGSETGNGAAVPSTSTIDRSWDVSVKGDDETPPSAAITSFSAVLSNQLAVDLRKRLQSVSLEIGQKLRE